MQVDDEMRCLLANLKAMVAAEAAAKSGVASGHCLTRFVFPWVFIKGSCCADTQLG